MSLSEQARDLLSRFDVLRDLESKVRDLMQAHESKRTLWYPHDLLGERPGEDRLVHLKGLRERARGIPDHARAALAVNTLTEEGLPHFHRLLAVYLQDDSFWRLWNNLWTAEEDRHGQVLHDYARDAELFDQRTLEVMQFDYLRAGFHPAWDKDPYRVFVYTTLQERATQASHAGTARVVEPYEPGLAAILREVAQDEARHFAFYRTVFAEVLERDPNQALESAAHVMPGIEMPGASMTGFRDLAEVIRRTGIYGPRDYLRIVQEQIKAWGIEHLTGLSEMGRKAQEKILAVPARLERIADLIETRSRERTFQFEVVFNREFGLP
ncbi:MAG: acyl-ACP desaturase [Gemmatimonadales bacterium]|jgi:acyl-[acyl-carrier-protein] desaturase|nr:acyl-ACP desaturase [Gemmatimonadales bacterium]